MSNLSEQELTAGISRRALDTMRHSDNGRKPPARTRRREPAPTPPPPAPESPTTEGFVTPSEPGTLGEHLAAQKYFGIEQPEKLSILNTWDRSLDLLNIDGWHFKLRDTSHSRGVHVSEISIDRPQLEMLAQRIHQALAEKGDA